MDWLTNSIKPSSLKLKVELFKFKLTCLFHIPSCSVSGTISLQNLAGVSFFPGVLLNAYILVGAVAITSLKSLSENSNDNLHSTSKQRASGYSAVQLSFSQWYVSNFKALAGFINVNIVRFLFVVGIHF